MVRRLQLMEPEPRGPGTRLAEAIGRLRDGLLRDNKVLPPVLAALALIIFAWLLAGVIIGDGGEEERVARQAAQPSVAQAPEGGGSSESPAPGVENRDNESLDVFESKDPFRELIPPADAGGGDDATGGAPADGGGADAGTGDGGTDGGTGSGGTDGTGSGGSDGSGSGGTDGTGTGDGSGAGSGDGSGGAGGDQYGGGEEDFLDQTSPGDPGFDEGSSGGGGADGSGSGGSGSGGSGQYGDGDGNGNLFDSGGGLGRR